MSFKNKIKKAFTGGEWSVAFRHVNDIRFITAVSPKNQWCADPFVYEHDGRYYIFVEQYKKDKECGCIGYFEFENGKPVNKGIIIENSYHMSYPDVFEFNGDFYMIPESSANSTIDLYIADQFPNNWRKTKTLLSGKKYVDSTVFEYESKLYLISYCMENSYEIHLFKLDMFNQTMELLSRKVYTENVARPGGRLFIENGKLIRPAQDCSRKYGESLVFYQVDDLNNDGMFLEHECRRLAISNIEVDNCPDRIHQFTSVGDYEVIDVFKERFDLFHVPRIFFRARRK